MLVLSRQRDETIMIGDDVEIRIVDIRGDKVRLGITAPTRVAVHRKEVYEAIKAENEVKNRAMGLPTSHKCGSSCPPQIKRAPKVPPPASKPQTPFRPSSSSRATTAA